MIVARVLDHLTIVYLSILFPFFSQNSERPHKLSKCFSLLPVRHRHLDSRSGRRHMRRTKPQIQTHGVRQKKVRAISLSLCIILQKKNPLSDACLATATVLTFSSQGAVFGIDEMSGGLALSHKLVLKTRDYPGNPGEVTTRRLYPR